MILLDAEHLLGLMMYIAPLDAVQDLAFDADLIVSVSSSVSEASALMVLATTPGTDSWGSRADARCRASQSLRECESLMRRIWRESSRCSAIEGRFSYWNHGDCAHRDATTRRQARVYRAFILELE